MCLGYLILHKLLTVYQEEDALFQRDAMTTIRGAVSFPLVTPFSSP